jgi:hypothetical protein
MRTSCSAPAQFTFHLVTCWQLCGLGTAVKQLMELLGVVDQRRCAASLRTALLSVAVAALLLASR